MRFLKLDFWFHNGSVKDSINLMVKAIPIGIANTLPGVSGGTLALILKIYDLLIKAIKDIKLNILAPVAIGVILGALASSRLISGILDNYPALMMSFLLGLILASTKVTFKEVEKIELNTICLFVIGFFIAFIISANASGIDSVDVSLWYVFFAGALSSMAMVLPGISGGTILILLGIYRVILDALSSFDLLTLSFFACGVACGLFIFSWLLSFLLDNYRSLLMAMLSGLILGSLRSVLPASFNLMQLITFVLGVLVVIGLEGKDKTSA